MGFRFRKSWKIAPGIRLNLGKKSASISFGRRGARYTVSSTGRKTATVGIPGTGISYSKSTGAATRGRDGTNMNGSAAQKKTRAGKPFYQKWWVWGIVVILLAAGASCGGNGSAEPDLSAEDEQIEQLAPDGEAVDAPAVTVPTQSEGAQEPEQEKANDTKSDSKKQDATANSGGMTAEMSASSEKAKTPEQERPKADPAPGSVEKEP